MSDTRHKNARWQLTANEDGSLSLPRIQAALLMDIRDELQKLNALLGCHNFVAVPTILRSIRRNTYRDKVARKAKKRTK